MGWCAKCLWLLLKRNSQSNEDPLTENVIGTILPGSLPTVATCAPFTSSTTPSLSSCHDQLLGVIDSGVLT